MPTTLSPLLSKGVQAVSCAANIAGSVNSNTSRNRTTPQFTAMPGAMPPLAATPTNRRAHKQLIVSALDG
jgi:hypothetical protein